MQEFEKHYHNLQAVFQELCDSNHLTDHQIEKINDSLSGLVEFYNSHTNSTPTIAPDYDLPFHSDQFRLAWENWKKYKKEQYKFTYKTLAEKSALSKLCDLAENDELTALKIIEQSMANGWKGLFKETQNASTGNNTKTTKQHLDRYKVETKSYKGRD